MFPFLTIETIDVTQKIVLVRADLNVPLREGKVTDLTRIERLIPTLKALAANQARIVILSHFGRPKGKVDPVSSLRQILPAFEKIWGQSIFWAPDCIGDHARQAIAALKPGHVLLLENLRFHPGEETNDPIFAKELAQLGDIYVNDAFSCSHRAHASVVGIANYLPAVAGISLQAEVEALTLAFEQPQRPLMAIIGGSKVSTKLALLENLARRVEVLVIGGGMANTFLLAQGIDIGDSLAEPDLCEVAKRVLSAPCEILLPQDWVWEGRKIMDIGPKTYAQIREKLKVMKTVVWNGPLGVFEKPPFDQGTFAVAQALAEATKADACTVAGGGDTLAALHTAGLQENDFTYVSTAGGAFLEWLEGKALPGIIALIPTHT